MSNLQIKIVSIELNDKMTKTQKPYVEIEVAFKNQSYQDKMEAKKVNPFGDKTVYDTLKNAKAGQVFTITRVKEGEYWQWVGITEGAASAPVASQGAAKGTTPAITTPAPKSTYETAEERAKKQVYIVRQSSISNAIEYMNGTGAIKKASAKDVTLCAKEFEQYVFGLDEVPAIAENLPELNEDDIPY